MFVDIVEDFGGPGGWDEALKALGLAVDIGIEHDEWTCKTRVAAGHHAHRADAADVGPADFSPRIGFIASPPCQGFSSAGKGAARNLIPEILDAIHRRDWGARPDPDPRVWLIVDLGRWLQWATPEWFALEQVPSVLPIWRAYALMLQRRGYSVWTGILNAADYGVPQTRERAILMASRVKVVQPPAATHDGDPQPSLFGTLKPWVTMADALGWGMNERPAFTLASGTGSGGADVSGVGGSGARAALHSHRAEGRWMVKTGTNSERGNGHLVAYERSIDEPSPTLRSQSRSWRVDRRQTGAPVDDGGTRPAPTLTAKAGGQWVFERPATTVMGDPRLGSPGHRDREGGEPQFDTDAIRLTVEEALILQSFRPDYPLQGSKTKKFEQVGNACPPLLAEHILRALI